MWHAFVKISVKHILLEWPITTELFQKNGYDLNACHNVTDILYNTDVTSHIVKLIDCNCLRVWTYSIQLWMCLCAYVCAWFIELQMCVDAHVFACICLCMIHSAMALCVCVWSHLAFRSVSMYAVWLDCFVYLCFIQMLQVCLYAASPHYTKQRCHWVMLIFK